MPVRTDKSQPYLIPSTPEVNIPSGPLTPIQQFIQKCRKSNTKEPKYNHYQPDYPETQRKGYKI